MGKEKKNYVLEFYGGDRIAIEIFEEYFHDFGRIWPGDFIIFNATSKLIFKMMLNIKKLLYLDEKEK